ncbi:cytochrome c3 family protein [Anaeromyxobacter oryzae]|uniref:Cytochrome c n=1 Tax=Anaeromyxobacter oryzae TaxID=2918170 RepID=A0ABM7X483_9BACT|nr:cytochrome c3 family protein [Anaeromyxobacter oryzae]BDG06567.1 cytochrome c [Anaeromyxobacter oryzae]
MTKYFAAMFAAVVVATSAFAAGTGPETITLQAKPGNVTFPHKAHQARGLKCETCHATAAGGKIEGFGKDKAHALCVECHKKEAKGPTKCADCHKKA